jgi:hypothetical protein
LRPVLDVILALDARNYLVAFGLRARREADIAEHIVVHGRLMGGHVRDAAGADDQYVLLHTIFPFYFHVIPD